MCSDRETRRSSVKCCQNSVDSVFRINSTKLICYLFSFAAGSDATLVHKNVASKNPHICYEAKLLGMQGERYSKPRKVFCYVSPKQLTIKEYLLKFIPKRLVTFRLCPSTKVNLVTTRRFELFKLSNKFLCFQFHFESSSNQYFGYDAFSIDDGCQPPVELISRCRNVIAATFTQFLLKNIGGSETFKDKQDFFYHEVRKHHQKHYHEKLSMKVQRDKLLESVSDESTLFISSQILDPKKLC